MKSWTERLRIVSPNWRHGAIALWTLVGMAVAWRSGTVAGSALAQRILLLFLLVACVPLLVDLTRQLWKLKFNVDLLAALSIASAIAFRQYWVAAVVILMLSGGKALEDYATRRASSILGALAKRMPQVAHRIGADGAPLDVALDQVAVGDVLAVFPHEICPVDAAVVSGNGAMDESYLTGEPFLIAKAPGATVMSGALNGDSVLTVQATRVAADSRYARIVQILKDSEMHRPHMRRIADRLAGWYTPAAILIALASWAVSGNPERFLAVLVIATPCPLLLAVPIAIIGAISVAGKRGIIIKDPAVLETIPGCETLIADKTGTLTYGRPKLQEVVCLGPWSRNELLRLAASLEQYSKHPLAGAVISAAQAERIEPAITHEVFEIPGHGVTARVERHMVMITGRDRLANQMGRTLPPISPGLESVVIVDGAIAGVLRFHDESRIETRPWLGHLHSRHGIQRVVLLSGDRVPAVEAFAREVGIHETYGGKSPEEKLAIVRDLTAHGPTLYIGDGVNDAPAMMSATAGIAMGVNSDITAEAAGAVILQSSLASVDELMHIGTKMRHIAFTSAIGGIGLSAIGIAASAAGYLKPIEGAVLQECIDLLSIFYALRMAIPSGSVGDFAVAEPPRTVGVAPPVPAVPSDCRAGVQHG